MSKIIRRVTYYWRNSVFLFEFPRVRNNLRCMKRNHGCIPAYSILFMLTLLKRFKQKTPVTGVHGGRSRDRTCDPYRVKVMLYR